VDVDGLAQEEVDVLSVRPVGDMTEEVGVLSVRPVGDMTANFGEAALCQPSDDPSSSVFARGVSL